MTDYGYYETDEPELVVGRGARAQKLVNATGALVSLALVVGMCVWGYRLMVRDVSGVPVIEAMEGAFRTQPKDPGGMTTPHQGLQVNQIAAVGSAAGPVDEVRLAPPPEELATEDAPWGELLEAKAEAEAVATEEAPAADDLGPAAADDLVPGLLAELEDVSPLGEVAPPGPDLSEEPQLIAPAFAEAEAEGEIAADTGPVEMVEDRPEDADPVELAIAEALAGSPVEDLLDATRPLPRPQVAGVVKVASSAPASAMPAVSGEVDVAALPKGTRLVQLGAYATPDIARAEWAKINSRFASFFTGKRMVVQEAVSGGKTFFRLRAEGFEDLADARRFCSALTAAQADCIPVEVR